MDGLFNKAAQFAQDYASKQGNDNNQQMQHGQGQNQNQGGMPGGFGGMAQQFMSGGQQQQQQQQYGGQQGQQGGAASEFFNKTGGAEYNAPHGQGGASSGGFQLPNFNNNAALNEAQQNSGQHGDSDMFSTALGFLSKFGKDDDIDEQKVVQQHEQVYQQGQGNQMDASSIGSAAALQAMKNFMGGGGQPQQAQETSGLNKIIGLALSEAAKMFDKSGGAASGTKQDAVNSAGATMMKLLIKSKFSGTQTTGGADSGGLGQLMGLASKFL